MHNIAFRFIAIRFEVHWSDRGSLEVIKHSPWIRAGNIDHETLRFPLYFLNALHLRPIIITFTSFKAGSRWIEQALSNSLSFWSSLVPMRGISWCFPNPRNTVHGCKVGWQETIDFVGQHHDCEQCITSHLYHKSPQDFAAQTWEL